ncbi:MAG: amidohydrolase family protein [Caldimicrobium sp.]|nr:amidohydrolase family protein [Caldimicrobium sp.]MCX7873087.1 amidohydrolase family protein [Caldimicrobium sp.]MDW8094512.1 amidohydrolase family protein [Caldimicrobium sp.]
MEEILLDHQHRLLIRGKLLFLGEGLPLWDGAIEIRGGKINQIGTFKELKKQSVRFKLIDLEDLVILPSLTNAHIHLELSPLRLRIPPAGRFIYWVRSIIKKRDQLSPLEIYESAKLALQELWREGIGILGEVTNTALTLEVLAHSSFRGYIFQEILTFRGSCALRELQEISPNFRVTYSAHAPYSVSPLLLQAIKAFNNRRGKLFTIHCAESPEEVEFLKSGKGPFRELLIERGQWQEDFKIPGVSPLKYLFNLGLLDEKTLLVHGVYLEEEDFEILSRTKAKLCICPKSNLFTGVGLPNLPKLLQAGVDIALGTDSLASNDRLSLFEEMKTLKLFYPQVSSLRILEMATSLGAKILGIKDGGTIKRGVKPDFIAVEVQGLPEKSLDRALDSLLLNEKKIKFKFYVSN